MFNRAGIIFALAAATLTLSAVPAHGAAIVYSDVTSWSNAVTGVTTINFNGIAPVGSFQDEGSSTGLTLSGVQFLGYVSPTAYQLAVIDSQFSSPYYNFGVAATLRGPGPDSAPAAFTPYIHVILPSGVSAIAATLATVSPNGVPFQVTLSDGETFTTPTGARPNATFFGLTAANPIAYVDFSMPSAVRGSGTFGLVQSFQFGTASTQGTGTPAATPEAATLIMIGTGLMALRGLRRYRGNLAIQAV